MKIGVFIGKTMTKSQQTNFTTALSHFKNVQFLWNFDYDKVDYIFSVGGDGSVIRCGKLTSKPIIGIDSGELGFLNEVNFSVEGIFKAINKLINKDFTIDKRTCIECFNQIAVNDICIKAIDHHLLRTKVFINDNFCGDFPADGILVSTPTGSTAYSLSCGGPILTPQSQSLIVIPICAHLLNTRALVINNTDNIKMKINSRFRKIGLYCDSQLVKTLNDGDEIEIIKSNHEVNFVRFNENPFYETLNKKMHWSKRIID